jgi:hypothetical protein
MPDYRKCNCSIFKLTDSSRFIVEHNTCDWTLDESDVISGYDEVAQDTVETEGVGPIQCNDSISLISNQCHIGNHFWGYMFVCAGVYAEQ